MPLSIKMVRGRMTWSMTKVINILMHSSCLGIYLSIPLLLSIILGHSTLLLLDLPLSPYYFWCPICNILIPSHFIVCILINLTKFPFFNIWSIGLYVLYIWIVNKHLCFSPTFFDNRLFILFSFRMDPATLPFQVWHYIQPGWSLGSSRKRRVP